MFKFVKAIHEDCRLFLLDMVYNVYMLKNEWSVSLCTVFTMYWYRCWVLVSTRPNNMLGIILTLVKSIVLPSMITDVVPSPTSSSCVLAISIIDLAAGCSTVICTMSVSISHCIASMAVGSLYWCCCQDHQIHSQHSYSQSLHWLKVNEQLQYKISLSPANFFFTSLCSVWLVVLSGKGQ